MSSFLNLTPLLDARGGLNVQTGQTNLPNNESGNARNGEPLRRGGLTKSPGLTLKRTLLNETQGWIVHQNSNYSFELLVYNYPFISKWDAANDIFTNLTDSNGDVFILPRCGNPRYEGVGPEKITHIVDGINNPMYYDEATQTINLIPWTIAYTNNNTDLFESSHTQSANPTSVGFPHDLVYVNNQMIYITPNDVGRAFFSLKGDSTEFWDNTYVGEVPINVAFFNDFPVTTPFTAIRKNPRGFLLYEMNGTSVVTGENPQIPGVTDTYQFQKINDNYGAIGPHAVVEMPNNEHFVLGDQGVTIGGLSDNFDQLTPTALSYKIQPLLDRVGREGLQNAKLFHVPNRQLIVMMLPRGAQYTVNSRLIKYFYGVSAANQTICWAQDEYFDLDPTDFHDGVYDPTTGKSYYLINNKIYEWAGTSYDGNPIRMEWETAPNDVSTPGVNKYLSAYWVLYKSESGATIHLDHSWENFSGGATTEDLPAKVTTQAKNAIMGVTKMQRLSAFDEAGRRVPISGSHIGKDLIIDFIHESENEDLTLYGLFGEYELLGVSA